ncbi:hypothetical protein BOS5A_210630 [Bosea sp. EC-HK365B]|nr:hypothetical protein BOSE7B_120491 [Bosea sp. 7B]CAD5276812.1 hypothetical protein BOSE21B_30423 [Bosea sp. 21B]VVT59839.1 hypothetical protein BOS5A_210630 [Bosea sp. EC-HK365B]
MTPILLKSLYVISNINDLAGVGGFLGGFCCFENRCERTLDHSIRAPTPDSGQFRPIRS